MSDEIVLEQVESKAPEVRVPDLDVSELARTDSDVLLKSIARNCVAVKVSGSAISTERTINNASVTVGGQDVPDELLAGAKFKIVPSKISNPLSRIMAAARLAPASYGTPFVGGAYLVPLSRQKDGRSTAQIVFDRINELKAAYASKAASLKEEWENHVENVRTNFPETYERVKNWFVDGDTFVSRHRISTMLFPLGAGLPVDFDNRLDVGFRNLINSPTLSESDREVIARVKPHIQELIERSAYNVGSVLEGSGSDTWVVEAQQATSAAIAEAVKTMVQEPITEFASALANVEGILSRGGVIKTATLENLRKAYDKLNGFSFMAPTELRDRLSAVGSIIEAVDMRDVNKNESASRSLAQHFAEVREAVTSEETHSAVYGRFRRGLSL